MGRHLEVIRSRANPALKRVAAASAGKERGAIVLEGERLVGDAARAGLSFELLLVSEEHAELADSFGADRACIRVVASPLLERVSALDTAPGVLALCRAPDEARIEELELGPRSLLLVVAGIADPGNLGALVRSAEALGVAAAIVLAGGASPWNTKALRGSMGSLLRLPVVCGLDAEAAARALERRGVRQVLAATRGGQDPDGFDWTAPAALWITSETGAVPPACADFERVTVPVRGAVESLNVAVAASLILSSAGRARGGGAK